MLSASYMDRNDNQTPVDDIDKRALAGETIIEPFSAEWGKGLVIALPMKSTATTVKPIAPSYGT